MLFFQELKRCVFSVSYLLFLILLVFGWYKNFYGVTNQEISASKGGETSAFSEITGNSILQKPDERGKSYGTKQKEVPDKIMIGGTDHLLIEYKENSYATYPYGYYKEVVLGDEEQKKILKILCEITGLTEEQLRNLPGDYFPAINGVIIHPGAGQKNDSRQFVVEGNSEEKAITDSNDKTKNFVSQVSYKRFKELMKEVEEIIGTGSYYSMDMLKKYYGQEEMNYAEAEEEYRKTINDDKVSTAFARLFCDGLARPFGLYPVFIVVIFWLKDRRSKITELIDCKPIGTGKIVVARFGAIITAMIIPAILLSLESLIPLIHYSSETGVMIDTFAFLKYILWWLLPTAMVVTALGMFLTILTDMPLAVILQIVWWFVDSAVTELSGDIRPFTLMIRHNTLNGSELIRKNFSMIWMNRGILIAASLILVILSCAIYDRKRRGKLKNAYWYPNNSRIFKKRF